MIARVLKRAGPGVLAAGVALAAGLVFDAGLSAAAAQATGPFGGFKHDSKAPIEITSDSLQVNQADHTAIFTGKVIAAQGTLHLTADKVTVIYSAKKGAASGQSNATANAPANTTGKIQSMRADGNVFLSNGSETAKGAWAEYDVANGMMKMGGDVVLTQGGNAISGQSLVINLKTGVGKITASGGGRVKSVFSPSSGKSSGN